MGQEVPEIRAAESTGNTRIDAETAKSGVDAIRKNVIAIQRTSFRSRRMTQLARKFSFLNKTHIDINAYICYDDYEYLMYLNARVSL